MTSKTLLIAAVAVTVALVAPASARAAAGSGPKARIFAEFDTNKNGVIDGEEVAAAFSVSVITSEFMNDFDFFDLAGDMAYTANLNAVDTQGNLRGYGATFTSRNGFYRLGLNDRVNTDRVAYSIGH